MSATLPPNIQDGIPTPSCPREVTGPTVAETRPHLTSSSRSIIPSKRSDDDIQFISARPVKKRRTTGLKPEQNEAQQVIQPPHLMATATPTNISGAVEAERRLSTGMVGLPSDLQMVELNSALRGVSMPVLENFSFHQPFRQPKPPSPPELSPKQLPQVVPPAIGLDQHGFVHSEPRATVEDPMAVSPMGSIQPEDATQPQSALDNALHSNPLHLLNHPVREMSQTAPCSMNNGNVTSPKNMDIPLVPNAAHSSSPISVQRGPAPTEYNHHDMGFSHMQHHSCQVCTRLRQQQIQLARAQGFPVMNHAVPQQMMAQLPSHAPLGQHLHPQMMAMGAAGLPMYHHPGFHPFMVPAAGSPFPGFPPHPQNAGQHVVGFQPPAPVVPLAMEKSDGAPQPTAAAKGAPVKTDSTGAMTTASMRPPASLVQSTHRKPSPNLIVDVSETCQEKFPFEEVAKRHHVPVEKVLDIFAAIIQVPLLRCPTDRRRTGRLATARVKEYNKVKKSIQDERAQGNTSGGKGGREECSVIPAEVAERMGQVPFPEGFTLGGQ